MIKVERSYPAPESLAIEYTKANGSYNEPDVVHRLRADFHDKCYICGLKGLQDPRVEHLLPHKNGYHKKRKFDWENLFWSCDHCNGVKNKEKYDSGILDCCKRDPETAMIFEVNEDNINVKAVEADDVEAALAAELVYETFNQMNSGLREYKCAFRLNELRSEMNALYTNLEKYKQNPNSKVIKRKLKGLLSKKVAFAAFKRCYVRQRLREFPELEEIVG